MFHKSIRWRIQAWHTALLVCLVAGMLGAFYSYEQAERLRAIDSQLQSGLTPLLPRILPPDGPGRDDGPPPPPGDDGPPDRRPRRPDQTGFAEFENGPFYYAAWAPDHGLLGRSSAAATNGLAIPPRAESVRQQYFRNRDIYRELIVGGPEGSIVVIGASTAAMTHEMRQLALTLVGVGVGITLFGLVGGWWVAGHALRPIGEISETARQIASGRRAQRIDVRETESELGQLAEMLNHTFDQQDSAFEQQVRFTADASHELRTPLSVILTQVQLALSREREGREYRETLQTCQRAAERMRALVNSLLELARVDSGDFQLKLEDCDLSALASDSMELIAPLARQKSAVLSSALQPVKTRADSGKLGQVLINLLYNAIQHNPEGVKVSLSVQSQGNEAVLRVADNGAGIPADVLPHVFERFYRADKSRGAKSGHGLGLSISQAIVQAHGGTIRAESPAGHGAIFTVSLPLAVADSKLLKNGNFFEHLFDRNV